MPEYTNADPALKVSLQDLKVASENEGWIVLKKDVNDSAFLSILFTNQYFSSQEEAESYLQNEIQKVEDANDLCQLIGINRTGNDTVNAAWSQYLNNVTHLVYAGIKMAPNYKGYYYMAVTNNDELAGFCEPIFLSAKQIAPNKSRPADKSTENKLVNHTLQYMHAYNSNWGSGGGTSTQKSFTLHADHSFRYSYSSVVSMGSLGGGTSREEGWGMWEVQTNNNRPVLILRWHLKPVSAYRLQWGDQGIIYLEGEKYLLT